MWTPWKIPRSKMPLYLGCEHKSSEIIPESPFDLGPRLALIEDYIGKLRKKDRVTL